MTVVRCLPSQRLMLVAPQALRPRVVLDLQVIRSSDFALLDGDDRWKLSNFAMRPRREGEGLALADLIF